MSLNLPPIIADESALAILREEAFQADRFDRNVPGERATRYRDGVREAVASLLDPFQPDNDEASRLANPSPSKRLQASLAEDSATGVTYQATLASW